MGKDDKGFIVSGLIAVGALLGIAFFFRKKSTSEQLEAAAISAFSKAYKKARETNLPVLIKEKNALYEIHPDGSKKFIKELPVSSIHTSDTFVLK